MASGVSRICLSTALPQRFQPLLGPAPHVRHAVIGFRQQVRQPDARQTPKTRTLAIPMLREVLVQQFLHSHPFLLCQQKRNVIDSFAVNGKHFDHADKLTPISKTRRKMGEC